MIYLLINLLMRYKVKMRSGHSIHMAQSQLSPSLGSVSSCAPPRMLGTNNDPANSLHLNLDLFCTRTKTIHLLSTSTPQGTRTP